MILQNLIKKKKREQIDKRGIKNHLRYNETFYIALIKNYNEIGWFTEANDAYFTYRSEKRKVRNLLLRVAEFIFLELTFGYGVRPINLIGTFIVIWLIPTFLYMRFIHYEKSVILPSWWCSQNLYYRMLRLPWRLFHSRLAWSFIYSLDTITPGINLKALETLNPYTFDSHKTIYIQRIQKLLGWFWLILFIILFNKIWMR